MVMLQPVKVTPAITAAIKALPFVKSVTPENGGLMISLDKPEEQNPVLVRTVLEAGGDVQYISEFKHSLEDVYFSLVGDSGAGG